MRIAVIGSGIAGLTASWLLTQSGQHTVDIYERAPQLGMDAHGYDLDIDEINNIARNGEKQDINRGTKKFRVDVPLRVFTESYYRNMTRLYEHVGVKFVPEDYSGSVTSIEGPSFFSYNNFVTRSFNVPYISPLRALVDSSYRSILYDVIRFHINMRRHLSSGVINHDGKTISLDTITIGQYFQLQNYSLAFQYQFILPVMQGICTCSLTSAASYPAHIVLHYLATQTLYGVKRVDLGTEDVVSRLSMGANVKCNSEIKIIQSHVDPATGATTVTVTSHDGTSETYDHVIMATQAHQILPLLQNPTDTVKQALSGFSIEKSTVILHTDTSLMPSSRAEWRPVNFILDEHASGTSTLPTYAHDADTSTCWNGRECMATIWMNKVSKHLKDRQARGANDIDIFQSWNPIRRPSPDKILCEGNFERPVIGLNTLSCIKQLWEEQGKGNIWYCGSYCLSGVPLLESAVTSAMHVAARFNALPPWHNQPFTTPVTSSPFTDLCIPSTSTITESSSSHHHVDPCKLHPKVPILSPISSLHWGICGVLTCLAVLSIWTA